MSCPYFSGFLLKEATPKKLITFMSQRCPLIKKPEHSGYEIACNRSWQGGPCNLASNQNTVTSNMSGAMRPRYTYFRKPFSLYVWELKHAKSFIFLDSAHDLSVLSIHKRATKTNRNRMCIQGKEKKTMTNLVNASWKSSIVHLKCLFCANDKWKSFPKRVITSLENDRDHNWIFLFN